MNYTIDIASKSDQIIIAQNNCIIQILLRISHRINKIEEKLNEKEDITKVQEVQEHEANMQQILMKLDAMHIGHTPTVGRKIETNPFIFRIFETEDKSKNKSKEKEKHGD